MVDTEVVTEEAGEDSVEDGEDSVVDGEVKVDMATVEDLESALLVLADSEDSADGDVVADTDTEVDTEVDTAVDTEVDTVVDTAVDTAKVLSASCPLLVSVVDTEATDMVVAKATIKPTIRFLLQNSSTLCPLQGSFENKLKF
ncbi:ctenidin-1 [Biomphalaria glabrata]|nr:Biomphalaria glabrata ctenidin-1-like [Biomphalaria glabrata]